MTFLRVSLGVLIAIACTIAFLAMTDEYERAMRADAESARVVSVDEGVVTYERYDPGSAWDDDGDGWVGPYTDEGVPAREAERLSPGDPLSLRAGQLELSLAPPSFLFIVGAVLGLLFAVWSIIAPIRERRAFAAAAADPMALFELMVKKTRSSKLTAALVIAALGGLLIAAALVIPGSVSELAFIGGLGVLAVLAGLYVGFGAFQLRDPKNAPVMRALRDTPERIVWVYEHRITVSGVDTHNLYLHLDDGTRLDLNLAQVEPAPLIAALGRHLGHAVIGYHPEWKDLYERSPQSFLQATASGVSASS